MSQNIQRARELTFYSKKFVPGSPAKRFYNAPLVLRVNARSEVINQNSPIMQTFAGFIILKTDSSSCLPEEINSTS